MTWEELYIININNKYDNYLCFPFAQKLEAREEGKERAKLRE